MRPTALLPLLLLTPFPARAAELSADDKRADLAALVEALLGTHPAPYAFADEQRWDEVLGEVDAGIDGGTDAEFYLGLARIVGLLQDGHTVVIPGPELGDGTWPVRFTFFDDGLFVTAAAPEQAAAVGQRVLAFGDFAVEDVVAALEPFAFGDNALGRRNALELFLSLPRMLHAAGVFAEPARGRLTLQDPQDPQDPQDAQNAQNAQNASGATRELALAPTSAPPVFHGAVPAGWARARFGDAAEPAWRVGFERAYWFRYDEQDRLLYLKYNRVEDDPAEPFAAFCERALAEAAARGAERFVVDLRGNSGGNHYLHQPLVHGLLRSAFDRPGRLFVITDRRTFSAAMNCASYLERETQALFVGEPTGGRPNHFGDATDLRLPRSGWTLACSTLAWQDSEPRDARPWIRPDLPAPSTFADWRAGRDAALAAIRAHDPARAARTAPNRRWQRPGQDDAWPDFLAR